MPQYGTTKKECDAAIAKLKVAGFAAWLTPVGHHMLWVKAAEDCFNISVPNVDAFIKRATNNAASTSLL